MKWLSNPGAPTVTLETDKGGWLACSLLRSSRNKTLHQQGAKWDRVLKIFLWPPHEHMYPHWLPERDINKYFKKSVTHILMAEHPWILYLRKKWQHASSKNPEVHARSVAKNWTQLSCPAAGRWSGAVLQWLLHSNKKNKRNRPKTGHQEPSPKCMTREKSHTQRPCIAH